MELIIGASCSSRPGLSEHLWVHRFNSRQKPGVTRGEPKNGVLILNRDWIKHRLPPCAPMALIICASCSSQPGLSEHMWVHRFNSRQNPGVTGGEPKHGNLALKRDCVEHILSPRAPMALILGASCRSQSGLSEDVWDHMPISRQNSGMPGGVLKHGDLVLKRDCVEHILSPRAPMALIIGASGRSQSGLSEHVWVHMSISRHKTQMYSYTYIHAYV